MRKIPVSAALLVLAMSGLGATLTRGQAKQGLPAPTERRVIYPEKDRKSTRLNSSHSQISYAVFCLKKKKFWAAPAFSHKLMLRAPQATIKDAAYMAEAMSYPRQDAYHFVRQTSGQTTSKEEHNHT